MVYMWTYSGFYNYFILLGVNVSQISVWNLSVGNTGESLNRIPRLQKKCRPIYIIHYKLFMKNISMFVNNTILHQMKRCMIHIFYGPNPINGGLIVGIYFLSVIY